MNSLQYLTGLTLLLALAGMFPVLVSAQAQPASRGTSEARLKQEVRQQIVMLPFYTVFDDIEYSISGSQVTLSGEVTNSDAKNSAENVIKGLEGVTKVTNSIQVLPASAGDDLIRHSEFQAIYGDPALERYATATVRTIHILVTGGRVTLDGVVSSQSDKDIIDIQAKEVPNVPSVMDNLTVIPSGVPEK